MIVSKYNFDPPRQSKLGNEPAFWLHLAQNIKNTFRYWGRATKYEKVTSVCLSLCAVTLLTLPAISITVFYSSRSLFWVVGAFFMPTAVLFGVTAVISKKLYNQLLSDDPSHTMLKEGVDQVEDRYIIDTSNQHVYRLYDDASWQIKKMKTGRKQAVFFACFEGHLFAFPFNQTRDIEAFYLRLRAVLKDDCAFLHTKNRIGYRVELDQCPKQIQSYFALEQI